MLKFGLRLGQHPQVVATTTPKPVHLVRRLIKQSDDGVGDVKITSGSTFDNAANLAPSFLVDLKVRYEGTRLGRQEIAGELLTDVEGALWNYVAIDEKRLDAVPEGVSLMRVIVAVDPPASSGIESAECGIVVTAIGDDEKFYVLADRSMRATPNEWARQAWGAYDAFMADAIVIEVNQGGEMATNTLKTVRQDGPIKAVHASRGKFARAEPISALYEQGRVHHVGLFAALEDQLCTWIPDGKQPSPDRLDALVWGLSELNVGITGDLLVGW
jgi:phage terminase large subunit-like protein